MHNQGTGISRRTLLRTAGIAGGAMLAGPLLSACSSEKQTSLTFLTGEDSTDTQKVWAQMFQDFTKKSSTITEVVPEYLSPDEALSRLTTLINTGHAPDVGKFDDVEIAELAYNGLLEPVTDIVKELGVPDGVRLRVRGEDYFVPTDVGVPLMFYRKDWFDEAGLAPPTGWADYLQAAAKLTDPSKQRYGDLLVTNPNSGYTTNVVLNQGWSNGGLFFDWDGKSWQVSVQKFEAQLAAALDWFKQRQQYSPTTANYAYAEVNQAFAAGRVAMVEFPGARTLVYLSSEFPDIAKVTGTAPLPANARPARKMSNGGLCIFKKEGRSPQAAKDLCLSMVQSPLYVDWLWTVPGHLLPSTPALFNGKWREHQLFKAHPDLLAALDATYPTGYSAVTGPSGAAGADINVAAGRAFRSGIYARLMSAVTTEGKSPQDALAAAGADMQKIIDQYARKA